jgi:amino acid adenylation domain-containing protein
MPPRTRFGVPPGGVPAPSAAAPGPAGDGLAYVAFTSGSTGRPRGILGSHAPLAHFMDWYEATLGLSSGDRFAMLSGLSHDPLLRDVFGPLWVGAELHVPEPDVHRTPSRLLRWLREREVTVLHLTPLLGRLLGQAAADLPDQSPALPRLRLACFGGDVLARADAGAFAGLAPGARLVNFYGATETPQAVSWLAVPPSAASGTAGVPIGPGIADTELLVLNRGRRAGLGELGEIAVRTPYLAAGYLADPALTADRFVPDPWGGGGRIYLTGDLGRHRLDGTIEPAGRRDGQVKVRGHRVELGDVEAALRAHPRIAEAVVVAAADRSGADALVAYAVAREERLAVPELRMHLQARLPEHMLPAGYVHLDRLPVTPNGKLDRCRLPAWDGGAARTDVAGVPPRDRVEEEIARAWREVLGLGEVGVEDNFFDLGGSSLAMIRVQSLLERRLDCRLSVVDLFRFPRIAALAAFVGPGERRAPGLERAHLRASERVGARRRRVPGPGPTKERP